MNPILSRVRDVIRESGMTQAALELAGVASQSAISAWRTRDSSEPSASSLAKLAELLHLNGHWLLTGQGDRRVVDGGGADQVYDAGVEAGLRKAEEAIRALRKSPAIPEPDEARARGDRGVEAVKKARGAHSCGWCPDAQARTRRPRP